MWTCGQAIWMPAAPGKGHVRNVGGAFTSTGRVAGVHAWHGADPLQSPIGAAHLCRKSCDVVNNQSTSDLAVRGHAPIRSGEGPTSRAPYWRCAREPSALLAVGPVLCVHALVWTGRKCLFSGFGFVGVRRTRAADMPGVVERGNMARGGRKRPAVSLSFLRCVCFARALRVAWHSARRSRSF